MAPRTTKHGASANARRTARKSGTRVASASRTSSSSGSRSTRASGNSRTAQSAARGRASSRSLTRKHSAPARGRSAARPLPWWTAPAAVVLAVMLFAWTYYPVARVQYRETREKQRLEAELESLQARNERLRKQVDRLRTPEGVEDYARSQLGLVKQGENVVVVIDDNAERSEPATTAPVIDSDRIQEGPVGPWTAFLDLVFGLR